MSNERVTVTLPQEIVESIDSLEGNRSEFVRQAVRREIRRRRREKLRQSLRNPHSETRQLAEVGLDGWEKELPDEEVADLVDPRGGKPVRWDPEHGWRPGEE